MDPEGGQGVGATPEKLQVIGFLGIRLDPLKIIKILSQHSSWVIMSMPRKRHLMPQTACLVVKPILLG